MGQSKPLLLIALSFLNSMLTVTVQTRYPGYLDVTAAICCFFNTGLVGCLVGCVLNHLETQELFEKKGLSCTCLNTRLAI